MKRLFRYGHCTVCVFVGLIISFFVFQYYESANQIDASEQLDKEKYLYKYELPVVVSGDSFSPDSLNYDMLQDCNIIIADQDIYFDAVASSCKTDIVISGNVFIYPLVSGHYPNESEVSQGTACAVLGAKMRQYTYRKNGSDYIKIHGDEYLVTGYIHAENSVIFDHRTILYYGCLGKNVAKDLDFFRGMGWTLLFQSNSVDTQTMLEALKDNFTDNSYFMCPMDSYRHFTASGAANREYKGMAVIVYIFSIFSVVMVIEYWLLCRRKEFAVRKACGYSNAALLWRIVRELVLYIVISVCVAELLLSVFNLVEKEAVIFAIKDFRGRIGLIVKYIMLTLLVLIIRPAMRLFFDNPIQILVEKDS